MNRRALLVSLSVAAVLPVVGAQAASTPQAAPGSNGYRMVVPAGFIAEDPSREMKPLADIESVIADTDTVGDQLAYSKAANALPVANPGKKFTQLGPYGVDMAPGYSISAERFARIAGMSGSAAVDIRDASGKTIYIGTMGGVWRSVDAGAHWTNLTDGKLPRLPVGAIALDPRHPGDLFVGTGIANTTLSGDSPGTGLYVSHDYGKTFTRPAVNVKGYAVNSIVPIATGLVVGTTHGLYVSSDRGASFKEILLKSNATHTAHQVGAYANWISAIAANPLRGGEVTVAIGAAFGKRKLPDGTVVAPGNGLYRSVNGIKGPFVYLPSSSGLTHSLASNDPLGRISLAYGPTTGQGNALWALVSDAGLTNGEDLGSIDIVSSTTGGAVKLNRGATTLNGLYRSGDDGATWTVKATPQSLTTVPNSTIALISPLGSGPGVQAFYNNWVTADPANPDHVFFGLEEVYQTLGNAGATPGVAAAAVIQRYADPCGFVTAVGNLVGSCPDAGTNVYSGQATHPDQHVGITIRTANGVRLYTGNDGGFFRQDSHSDVPGGFDNGSWTAMNTIANTQPYHVARKPDGEILFALQDNGSGFFKPGQRGLSTSGGDGVLVMATSNPDVFYTSSQGANLYVTKDHGKTNTNMKPPLDTPVFTSPVVMDPTDENHLVAAASDVQESTDGPDTVTNVDPAGLLINSSWTQTTTFGNSGVVNNGNPVRWTAQAVAVRGARAYVALCGLCRNSFGNPKLIKTGISTNVAPGCTPAKSSSKCWHYAAGKGLPHVAIQELVIDPQNANTIYVVLNENSLVGLNKAIVGSARVMVSRNAGESFTDITGNLPRSNMRDVVLRNGQIIVAGDNGIFTAKAGTTSWKRLAEGLPQVRIYDLSLNPSGRYLTIATYGRAVWQYDFGTAAAHSSAGPGPFGEPTAPSTRPPFHLPLVPIGWGLAMAMAVLLAGRKVRALRLQPVPGRLATV